VPRRRTERHDVAAKMMGEKMGEGRLSPFTLPVEWAVVSGRPAPAAGQTV
jgi:hypothetical protein